MLTGARRVGGVSRPYLWHRWVCFLHGCVVNDEWFPLCLKACCHILVNEAASYSLVGVMGLAWLQLHLKKQGAAESSRRRHGNEKWLNMTFTNMATTRFPPFLLTFFIFIFNNNAQTGGDFNTSADVYLPPNGSFHTDICWCTLNPLCCKC